VKIKIYGKVYTVKTDPDVDLEVVADYVDSKMKELSEAGKGRIATADLAVLTALNLAQELMAHKKAHTGADSVVQQRLGRLADRLDEKLESIKTKGVAEDK